LTGGFLLGWSVTIWFLSERVYDRAPEAARQTFLIGVCAWFVLDSAGSVTSGNPSNAAFNLLVLLVVVGPMWRPARDV